MPKSTSPHLGGAGARTGSGEGRGMNLFDTEDRAGAFVLWHRTGSRGKWRPIGAADTQAGALALMDDSGHTGGDWVVKPSGVDPNSDKPR